MKCILINTSISSISPKLLVDIDDIYYISDIHNANKINGNIKYLNLHENEKSQINKYIFSSVLKWGDKFVEGETINQFLSFNGFNLWQYHRFRVYFEVRNIEYEIQALNKLREAGYRNIYIISDLKYDRKSFIKDVDFVFLEEFFKKTKKNYLNLFKYILIVTIRTIFGIIQLLTKKKSNTNSIIVDASLKQACITERGKLSFDNYNLAYLLNKIDKRYLVLSEITPPKSGTHFSFSKTMNIKTDLTRNVLYSEIIMFKCLISHKFRRDFKVIKNNIENKYKFLNQQLANPYDKLILDILKRHQSTNYFYLFRFLCYQRFFFNSNFQNVIALDENGPMSRSILDAAKSNHIKTIGIQHGAIHELHPNYYYSKNEVKFVPDFTIVWGKKWSDLLEKMGNYPKESLFIAGQIRTDIIPKLLKQKPNNKIFTIVYASQPQRDIGLKEKTARAVFEASSKFPDVFLRVKLHPQEFNDIDYYQKLAIDSGLTNYEILENAELYLVLASADVVITSFSTVGIEAIYFKKPLIIYDPLKQDLQKYHEEGVASQAIDSMDIFSFIQKIKDGEILISESHYRDFIDRNAYKIDGHVVDRCLEFIEQAK